MTGGRGPDLEDQPPGGRELIAGRLASEAVERWDAEESGQIVVGRRMRTGRRRPTRGGPAARIVTIAALVLLLSLGVGAYFWLNRPTGLDTLPSPAVVAPGGFRASVGDGKTVTVGLEVRNTAERPLTLTDAQIIPPAGLTLVGLTILAPGEGNQGFALEGDLPSLAPVQLGIDGPDRNAIVAARFTVDCERLPTLESATPEQIFVTISFEGHTRVEELTPPVVDDVPWLLASAQRSCLDPVPAGSPEPPLPPLPDTEGPPESTPSGG